MPMPLCLAGCDMRAKKAFDAVDESRRWKEAVVREAEGMTMEETKARFDRATVRRRFDTALRQAEQADEAKGKEEREAQE
jgi:hypothetical protein